MKRSVLLILTALGLVWAAFACASASAETTVLCKANEEPCEAANIYPEGTTITAETKEASDQVKIATESVTITCPSKLEATVGANSGGTRLLSVSSWSLGNSSEWCTGIAKGDCGTTSDENVPYAGEAIWPEQSVRFEGPNWHLHCAVGGSTYLDCTYYISKGHLYFTEDHKGFQYTEYGMSHTGYACTSLARLSVTYRIVKPESPIYVSFKASASAPKATTKAATSVSGEAATLNGTVNPEGFETNYHFEWGNQKEFEAGKYNHSTAEKSIGSGEKDIDGSQEIKGLEPATTYHFRVVASGELGELITYGEDEAFTTLPLTTLCKVSEAESNCAKESRYPAKTTITAELSKQVLITTGLGNVECSSTLKAHNETESGVPLAVKIEKLTFSNCNGSCEVEQQNAPVGSLAWSSGVDGALEFGQGKSPIVRVECNGLNCSYFLPGLTLKGGNPAQLSAKETALVKEGGSLCESATLKPATYTVTAPKPLYVAKVKPPPPDTTISAGSTGTVTPDVAFSFTSPKSGPSFECSLDAGSYSACTSPKSYQGLAEGSHTFKVRAVGSGGADPTPAERSVSVITTAKAVSNVAVLDSLQRQEVPLATGKWTKTSWAEKIGGAWTGEWNGYGGFGETLVGAYWNPTTFSDAKAGLIVTATLGTSPASAGEYLSLWLDMPNPGSARSGYEARFTGINGSSSNYKVELSKWVGGTRTVLASKKEGFSLSVGTTMALTETGGALTLWTGTSSFSSVLSATDSTYSSGYAGLEANGGNGTEYNFRAGEV